MRPFRNAGLAFNLAAYSWCGIGLLAAFRDWPLLVVIAAIACATIFCIAGRVCQAVAEHVGERRP